MLNKEKMQLRLNSPYIDHLLTSDGIKPDPKKVDVIIQMPQPTDVPSVKRLLVNYTFQSFYYISTITEPLRRLEDKDVEWYWDKFIRTLWKK